MARRIVPLLAALACSSCMEMRETVQRMVMVRTTGSDLQPAATGYIYKKESDGPASVLKMGESEVMEHLSKIYQKPEAYIAPVPAAHGPFHEKEAGNSPAASHASEAYVIPVEEHVENADDTIDGIADEDYGKYFKGYGNFGDNYKDFADYLHGVGHYGHGLHHERGGGNDYGSKDHHAYGDKGYKGYGSSHKYGKGGSGDYHTEKYESFSVSSGKGHDEHHGGAGAFGKNHEGGRHYDGGDHGHKAAHTGGKEVDGYHRVFDKDEQQEDHDVYDAEKHEGDFHKHGVGDVHHGSDAGGFSKGGEHESGHHESAFGKGDHVDEESGDEDSAEHSGEDAGEASHQRHGDFASSGGKSYSFAVKHR